jgi:hypothetical protein
MSGIVNATTELDEHDEIEITKEMIEAGINVLWSRDDVTWGPTYCEIIVESILRAALQVSSRNHEDPSKF